MLDRYIERGSAVMAFLSAGFSSFTGNAQEKKSDYSAQRQSDRPNIVLVISEDLSPRFGCYGDRVARTPNIDALAAEGVRFTNAHTMAGVSGPSRSGLITGVFQNFTKNREQQIFTNKNKGTN